MISWDIVTTLNHCFCFYDISGVHVGCLIDFLGIPEIFSFFLVLVLVKVSREFWWYSPCKTLNKVWACNDQVILYRKVQFFEVSPKGLKDGVVRHARWLVCHHLCGVS